MRERAADFHHEPGGIDEERCPAWVSERGNEDFARLYGLLLWIAHDMRNALYYSCRDRVAHQCS